MSKNEIVQKTRPAWIVLKFMEIEVDGQKLELVLGGDKADGCVPLFYDYGKAVAVAAGGNIIEVVVTQNAVGDGKI